jgi:hypothetical protein
MSRAAQFAWILLLSLSGCFPEEDAPPATRGSEAGTDSPPADDTGDTALPDTADTDTDTDADTDADADADTDTDTDTDTDVGAEDRDGDGWTIGAGDCDDTDATVSPDAGEAYDAAGLGVDDDCDGDIDEAPVVLFTTDSSRVWIELQGAQRGSWWFGMAETGDGDAGWYGEDCIDDPADDADYGYEFCHPFDGDALALRRGYDVSDVISGEVTLFYDALLDDVTFYLATDDETICWVWGDDPDWYTVDSHAGAGPLDCVVE